MLIIAADIGGTNARFARFETIGGNLHCLDASTVSSKDHSFIHVVDAAKRKLLTDGARPDAVCVAAAGIVEADAIRLTNASMTISKQTLSDVFQTNRVFLMNDFEAQARASSLPQLRTKFISLKEGKTSNFSRVTTLGAGTGFGVAHSFQGSVLSTEFGHVPFYFDLDDDEELAFAKYIKKRLTLTHSVNVDDVVSGRGLTALYAYFTNTESDPRSFTREENFSASKTCALFSRFYARAVRSVLFANLPDLVVITGGMVQKTPVLVTHRAFQTELFRAQDSYLDYLKAVPLFVNPLSDAGLYGAASVFLSY